VVATKDGVAAVEALIAEGINVNITLIFSLLHYEAVAAAYIRGLERCISPDSVSSVASFFVSRVDIQVDKALDANGSAGARALQGKIAIANAKAMYRRFREIFHGEQFSALRNRGARVQRPLWASTGTKNPSYRDVLYIEELIGPDTVNTVPPKTLDAFRDHGKVRGDTVLENWTEAERNLHALSSFGVNLESITDALQADGLKLFASAYERVLNAIAANRRKLAPISSRA
jgi:transaldolase